MSRLVTLMTSQWADLEMEEMFRLAKEMGYDGVELACWGKHLDLKRAVEDDTYIQYVKELLKKYDLECHALATHIIGQCVGDYDDPRLDNFAPAPLAGQPDAIRAWAVEYMRYAPVAAKKLGCEVVTGFVGSGIWKYIRERLPMITIQRKDCWK